MELHIKVAQAVHVLNHDTQSCNRVAANQWLVHFQQTQAAWEIATSILVSDHRQHHQFAADFEVEFFAAQILKRKVSLLSSSFNSQLKFTFSGTFNLALVWTLYLNLLTNSFVFHRLVFSLSEDPK